MGSQSMAGPPLPDLVLDIAPQARAPCPQEAVSPLPRPFVGLLSDRALPLQVSQEPVRPEGELWRIQAQAGLSAAAIVAVDIFFHFFYILTIPSDLKFASRLPDSALGGSPKQGGVRAVTRILSCTQHPRVLGLGMESESCRIHLLHHTKTLLSQAAGSTRGRWLIFMGHRDQGGAGCPWRWGWNRNKTLCPRERQGSEFGCP